VTQRGYNDRQIGLYLPEDLFVKLQKKVHNCGYERTLSAVVRALIRKWVRGEIDIDV
jgi:hypothetical protein